MVTIVKQADIPGVTHARQKVQERPRAFGKLEAIQEFMGSVWGMTTNHVTDVQFGHFVIAEVESVHAMRLEGGNQSRTLLPALYLHTHEDHGLFRISITIIEFGNVAGAQ